MDEKGNYPHVYPQVDHGGNTNMGYAPPPQAMHPQPVNTTMVVINQPGGSPDWQSVPQNTRDWSTEMCGCCDDIAVCCFGYFCGWCLLCQITQETGQGCCVACCCPLVALFGSRLRLRTMFGIRGDMCMDACCSMYCTPLVLCQLKRQLKIIKEAGGNVQ